MVFLWQRRGQRFRTGGLARMPQAQQTPQHSKRHRWAEYLLAILGGNVIFLLLEPHLPRPLRHEIFRLDWGLAVDFLFCVALYGLIRWTRFFGK